MKRVILYRAWEMPATEFSTLRWYIFGNIVPVKFFVYTTYIWNMSQDSRKYIAQNVKKYRTAKGFKKEELSLFLGFDNSYISKLERATVNITIDRLEQIPKILDVDVINLLEH